MIVGDNKSKLDLHFRIYTYSEGDGAVGVYLLPLNTHPCIRRRGIFGPLGEKRDLRTYANSKDPNQPAFPISPIRILAVHLHNIGTLLKI